MAVLPQWRQFVALAHELRCTNVAALDWAPTADADERRSHLVAFWVNVYNSLFLFAWVMRG